MRLLKIGRDATCDITINSKRISGLHAEMTLLNSGDILLEDKGSMNGTFVQNQRLQPGKSVNIRRGDAIRFADVELQWSQVPIEDNSGYRAVWGIGTDFHNDFQLSGATVSRFHATVKQANDGKFYLVDHSKNGTTVDGRKIVPNSPQRIKKNSAISCGGVPVDLKQGGKIDWPSDIWKILLATAASLLVLVGIGFGMYKLINKPNAESTMIAEKKDYTDQELYDMYHNSVGMLTSIYSYEMSIEGMTDDDMNTINMWLAREGLSQIPKRFVLGENGLEAVGDLTESQRIELIKKRNEKMGRKDEGAATATGFLISQDGKILTNLHVVKPWLFNDDIVNIKTHLKVLLSAIAKLHEDSRLYPLLLTAMTDVKVKGILDYIAFVPDGETFDESTTFKCRVISAGDDNEKDVAMLQTMSKSLPTPRCGYVDISKKMETSEDSLTIGTHIFTMGFPIGNRMQEEAREEGIKAISQGGSITQLLKYKFSHNAAIIGGCSGSPIFNKHGKLIGIVNAGWTGTQGFNYGVKTECITELIEKFKNIK